MKSAIFQDAVESSTRVFGRKDVRVIFQGGDAKTDGNTVYLPSLPPAADITVDQADVIRGFRDHESMHVRCTDTSNSSGIRLDQLTQRDKNLGQIAQYCEDIRIEHAGTSEYAGMKFTLGATNVHASKMLMQQIEAMGKPAEVIPSMPQPMQFRVMLQSLGRKKLGIDIGAYEEMVEHLKASNPKLYEFADKCSDEMVALPTGYNGKALVEKVAKQGTAQALDLAESIHSRYVSLFPDQAPPPLPPPPPGEPCDDGEPDPGQQQQPNPDKKPEPKPEDKQSDGGDGKDGNSGTGTEPDDQDAGDDDKQDDPGKGPDGGDGNQPSDDCDKPDDTPDDADDSQQPSGSSGDDSDPGDDDADEPDPATGGGGDDGQDDDKGGDEDDQQSSGGGQPDNGDDDGDDGASDDGQSSGGSPDADADGQGGGDPGQGQQDGQQQQGSDSGDGDPANGHGNGQPANEHAFGIDDFGDLDVDAGFNDAVNDVVETVNANSTKGMEPGQPRFRLWSSKLSQMAPIADLRRAQLKTSVDDSEWVAHLVQRSNAVSVIEALIGGKRAMIRRILELELQARSDRRWESGKTHGRLHMMRVVNAIRGDDNVYQRREDGKDMDTLLKISIDGSGSMTSNRKMFEAVALAYALCEALERTGCEIEVSVWDNVISPMGQYSGAEVKRIKDAYDEDYRQRYMEALKTNDEPAPLYTSLGLLNRAIVKPVNKRLSHPDVRVGFGLAMLVPNSFTPGVHAVFADLADIAKDRHAKRIYLHITDGDSDAPMEGGSNSELMAEAQRMADQLGVHMIGVGVGGMDVSHMFRDNVNVEGADAYEPVIKRIAKYIAKEAGHAVAFKRAA